MYYSQIDYSRIGSDRKFIAFQEPYMPLSSADIFGYIRTPLSNTGDIEIGLPNPSIFVSGFSLLDSL